MFDLIHVGNVFRTADNDIGNVVAVIETGEYSDEYDEKSWSMLTNGVLILFDVKGLVHYDSEIKFLNAFRLNPELMTHEEIEKIKS